MTTFIIRLVAILYSWLMAIKMAHFELEFSSYYSSIQTSIVATIVTSPSY